MITIEKFDRSIYDNEKTSFQIGSKVFNVSEGTYTDWNDDELWCSPLWKHSRSNEELRQTLWVEIKRWLPVYLSEGKSAINKSRRPGYMFLSLMQLVETYLEYGELKLIYISDREHAELIKRCVLYLETQLPPQF